MNFHPTLDKMLACGTDTNVWKNWSEVLNTALKSGESANFGIVKYTRSNASRMLEIRCIPVSDRQAGHLTGGALVLNDVTDRLESEHEMASTQRLMAIGKVAGKVAHELNNPLDGILRYVNLTLRILDQQPQKAREYLNHCRTGLQRMAQIITEMLEFSRSANQAMENSPIDKLLDDAIRAMESSMRHVDVQVIRNDSGTLPHIKSDSLFQVFCNLIKNACDAMDGQGQLIIKIERNEGDCFVEFTDTGHGFDPQYVDEMFRPFFTTKPKGRGTGLGLAICKDILEKLNGSITAHNNPGGGAIFRIHLPCSPQINHTKL